MLSCYCMFGHCERCEHCEHCEHFEHCEHSIILMVHLSLELQPLLQLASSDVNLTCGVINKFSIRSLRV